MLRLIKVQGPVEAIDAVVEIGNEGLLDFQDYFRDAEHTHSALLIIFDDAEQAECEVLTQARTLLSEKGVDPMLFWVNGRWLFYPDALEWTWYERMEPYGQSLLGLEALGVRTLEQQVEMDYLREWIRYRVACASEVAEANIAEFTGKIEDLMGHKDY